MTILVALENLKKKFEEDRDGLRMSIEGFKTGQLLFEILIDTDCLFNAKQISILCLELQDLLSF